MFREVIKFMTYDKLIAKPKSKRTRPLKRSQWMTRKSNDVSRPPENMVIIYVHQYESLHIFPFCFYAKRQKLLSRTLNTMWNFQHFSDTQILREINL